MNHSDSLLVSSGFSWRGGKQLGNNHDALFQTSGPAATAAVITATTAATAPLGQCSRVNKNKLIINFSNKSSFLTMHSKLIFELILLPISQLFHQSILQLILHPISPLLSVNPNPSGNPSFDQSAVPSDDHSSFPSANQSAVCISRSVIWSFRGLFSWSSADQSADPSADQSTIPSADQSAVPSFNQS